MRMKVLFVLLAAALGFSGCNKSSPPPAASPTAALTLKDGTVVTGTVTNNDTSAISLQTTTGETRTYPMSQIAQVNYGKGLAPQSPSPVAANQPAPPANVTPPPPVSPMPVNPMPANPAPLPPARSPTAAPVPPFHPAAEFRTIPAGVTISVRNNQTIDSETSAVGQTYSGVVAHDVVDSRGSVAIPRGSAATLVVRDASGQGKVKGRSELAVDVGSVAVGGHTYRLETSDFSERGKEGLGANKRTGEFLGGGTALGGIIGAIAGGGKGAAIGALSGAAAGGATQTLTRGNAVRIPAETVLNFQLEAPIRIREMR